jgi:hypothetical protein
MICVPFTRLTQRLVSVSTSVAGQSHECNQLTLKKPSVKKTLVVALVVVALVPICRISSAGFACPLVAPIVLSTVSRGSRYPIFIAVADSLWRALSLLEGSHQEGYKVLGTLQRG